MGRRQAHTSPSWTASSDEHAPAALKRDWIPFDDAHMSTRPYSEQSEMCLGVFMACSWESDYPGVQKVQACVVVA